MNIGALSGLASAICLIPQLIPVWGFLKMPERCPEDWNKAAKLSKVFASLGSRIALCLLATVLVGIFVVLNILNFSKFTTICFFLYFMITGIICFGFGDKMLAKRAEAGDGQK